IDKETRVSDLPAVGAAHESSQLSFDSLPSPRRLLLEGAEGSEVAVGVEDGFDGGGTEGADQLVLQVCDTDVETQLLHIGAREVGAEARLLETAPEHFLLAHVTQTGDPRVRPPRAEASQE